MARTKGTAVNPLTGEQVNGAQVAKLKARSSMRASDQTPPKEGEVMSLRQFALEEFGAIVAFESSRIERWIKVIRAFYRAPGDFESYGRLVKEEMLKSLGVKPGSGFKTWPVHAQEIFKSRYAQHLSAINRVEFALKQWGADKVVAVLGAATLLDLKKAQGIAVLDSDATVKVGYSQKLITLPKETNRGRTKGSTNSNKGTGPGSSIKVAEQQDNTTPAAKDALVTAAKQSALTEVCTFIEHAAEESVGVLAMAVALRMVKSTDPDFQSLGTSMRDALVKRIEESKPKAKGKKAA